MILKIQTLQKRLILKSEEVTYTYMMPIKKAHASLLYNASLGDFKSFYQLDHRAASVSHYLIEAICTLLRQGTSLFNPAVVFF